MPPSTRCGAGGRPAGTIIHTVSHRPPFAAYLFDLDGTLIDSIALITSSFEHTLRTHHTALPTNATLQSGFGTPLRTQLAKVARNPAEVEAMTATYREYHATHHDRLVQPYPGIREVVTILRGLPVKLAIVTSKGRNATERGLRRCALDGLFDVIVTVDDVTEHKPHPAPVVEALRRLSAEADDAVFIGDSPHDVESGRGAGVRTAAALWGPFSRESLAVHRPDYWLSHPEEVMTALGHV